MKAWLERFGMFRKAVEGKTSASEKSGELLFLVDMHAHWIPGIDDGAKDLEESLDILRALAALGYRHLIATPHVMADYYRNTAQDILQGLALVRQACTSAGLNLSLAASAEYYLEEHFLGLLAKGEVLPMANQYVLFELSYLNRPGNLQQGIFSIQSAGLVPILAHPERYPYFAGETRLQPYRELVEQGVCLQINLGSLTGQHGPQARKTARTLIDAGLVHFAGTDVHRATSLDAMGDLVRDRWYQKFLDSPMQRMQDLLPSAGNPANA